jgi:hypothetical protein
MRSHRWGVLALLAALCSGVVLDATVVVPLDLRELVSQAATIAYGRVVDVRAFVAGGRTESVVTLGAPFFLKGSGGREVVFRLPGGRVGRYRTVVMGTPVLQAGDEVVVFLAEAAGQPPTLIGFSQGLLKVSRPARDAAPMLLSPPVSRGTGTQRVVRGTDSPRFMPLAEFVGQVRGLVAGPDGSEPGTRPLPRDGKTGGW